MFAWKEKKNPLNKVERLCAIDPQPSGLNRRAIGLLPLPQTRETHEISQSESIRYTQLLLTMEAKQSSCCLRIIAPGRKARSAILIYKGRVIGCLHGNKNTENQIFGREAHEQALVDLAQPSNIVDAYLLSEEIVLAAASLFHGNVMKVTPNMPPVQVFIHAIKSLVASNSVGCVVISNSENFASCMVYIFAGKIVGVYSFAEGWLEPTLESGLDCLQALPDAKIMASAFTARNESEALSLTFSLTGLSENFKDRQKIEYAHNTVMESKLLCHKTAQAENYRTSLQLEHIEFIDSGNQAKNFDPTNIRRTQSSFSIDPAGKCAV
jgi:hypothetical protein